jgi:hypothetical protein
MWNAGRAFVSSALVVSENHKGETRCPVVEQVEKTLSALALDCWKLRYQRLLVGHHEVRSIFAIGQRKEFRIVDTDNLV